MNNGMLRRVKFILFSILFFTISIPFCTHAYDTDVHAYLTKEAVSFYLSHFTESKVSDEFESYLIDGSRREDDVPRWMNHFYDPVNNRGLTYDPAIDPGINTGTWEISKDWATDVDNQNKLTYKVPATIASILTAVERQKINDISTETDFTWKSAKDYYLGGKYEKAFFALGHVLHLIEDLSVPSHTRNDVHPGDSPYEEFTKQFTFTNPDTNLGQRLEKKDVLIFSSLGEYFDSLAKYSNSNFYSKDTIGIQSGYQSPASDDLRQDKNFVFIFNTDKEFGDYHLVQVTKNIDKFNYLISNKNSFSLVDINNLIQRDYWSRLSTKAVQYSAGVIDLFFKEVEEEKENGTNVASEKPKSFFAALVGFVDAGVGGLAELFRGIFIPPMNGNVPLGDSLPDSSPQAEVDEEEIKELSSEEYVSDESAEENIVRGETEAEEKLKEIFFEDESSSDKSGVEKDKTINISSSTIAEEVIQETPQKLEGGGVPGSQFFDVRINEIMYDVPGADTGKEWIEVLNYEWDPVDICGWKFFENGVNHKLTLARGFCSVSPGGYAVIVRDEVGFFETYPGFRGTVFTSSFSLNNDGETISLKNGDKEIDVVTYSSDNGAKGDGNSLQKTSSGWYARIPTPGSENALTGGGGATNTNTVVQMNVATSSTNKSPHPYFLYSPQNPLEGENVLFDASFSNDADGSISSYTWDFGDGFASSTTLNSISHIYSTPGNFTARLAVLDNGGESSSTSTQIEVSPLIETATTTAATHLVISEILFDAKGSDAGKEFIELYNPTEATIDVDGWALRYSLGSSTTTETLAVFNKLSGDNTIVGSRGFLLNGFSNYDSLNFGGVRADTIRSHGIPNGSAESVKIVLFDDLGREVDSITYSSSSIGSSGESLERKSVIDALCVSPEGINEFSGNACDRDSPYDFLIRTTPYPQNSENLMEPRGTLVSPAALDASKTVQFNKRSMSLGFNWEMSTSSDSRAVVTYRITDISSGTQAFVDTKTTTSTEFVTSIMHVGREYRFEMQAFDQEGLTSTTSSYIVSVPSFFSEFFIYPDLREGVSQRYAIDAYYDAFPFIPDIFGMGMWQGLVFYINRGANGMNKTLVTANGYTPDDASGVLMVAYRGCIEGSSESPVGSFIFPLGTEWCGPGGGLKSSSFAYSELEDDHFIIHSASSSAEFGFSSDDYLTIAYYSFESSGAGSQNLSLVAVDDVKFFFQNNSPSQYAPEIGALSSSFDEPNARLTISWDRARDLDSIDSELVYELNFTPLTNTSTTLDATLWSASTTQLLYEKTVTPGDAFLVGVRAQDDFGNMSNIATTTWSYPTTNFSITQEANDSWSSVWGTVSHSTAEPDTASFQSFAPQADFSFNKAIVKIRQTLVNDVGNLRLSVYPANASGTPEFASPLGEAVLAGVLNPDETQEQTFTFGAPISVAASRTYWLVLDVASYSSGGSGYFRNRWQNAIASGGEAYTEGVGGLGYARGANATCEGCLYERPYLSGPADWYFKLGLKE